MCSLVSESFIDDRTILFSCCFPTLFHICIIRKNHLTVSIWITVYQIYYHCHFLVQLQWIKRAGSAEPNGNFSKTTSPIKLLTILHNSIQMTHMFVEYSEQSYHLLLSHLLQDPSLGTGTTCAHRYLQSQQTHLWAKHAFISICIHSNKRMKYVAKIRNAHAQPI